MLTGVGALTRFLLRRDRLRLALWVGGIVAVVIVSAASLVGVYPDQEAIENYARLVGDNPAPIAFAGHGHGFDEPAGAPASRSNPLGLALRLQRGPIVGWAIGLFLTGVVYGSLGNDIEQMILDNPTFEDIFIQLERPPLTDAFFGTALAMLAVVAGGFSGVVSTRRTWRGERWSSGADPRRSGEPVALGGRLGRRRRRRILHDARCSRSRRRCRLRRHHRRSGPPASLDRAGGGDPHNPAAASAAAPRTSAKSEQRRT